jgi:hypothetical protein
MALDTRITDLVIKRTAFDFVVQNRRASSVVQIELIAGVAFSAVSIRIGGHAVVHFCGWSTDSIRQIEAFIASSALPLRVPSRYTIGDNVPGTPGLRVEEISWETLHTIIAVHIFNEAVVYNRVSRAN